MGQHQIPSDLTPVRLMLHRTEIKTLHRVNLYLAIKNQYVLVNNIIDGWHEKSISIESLDIISCSSVSYIVSSVVVLLCWFIVMLVYCCVGVLSDVHT